MERKLSTFDLALRQRPYVKSPGGTFQTERNYLDFVIDGQSLAERTRYDVVSVLCKKWALEEREKSVRRLSGRNQQTSLTTADLFLFVESVATLDVEQSQSSCISRIRQCCGRNSAIKIITSRRSTEST
jgi:hypothetical protein